MLDLGGANDEMGHGVSELTFDDVVLTFTAGTNEDFIIVEGGSADLARLDARFFTEVELTDSPRWVSPRGRLVAIDLFSDGFEDVALRLRFEDGDALVLALVDTDFVIARDLHVFDSEPGDEPSLRETVE